MTLPLLDSVPRWQISLQLYIRLPENQNQPLFHPFGVLFSFKYTMYLCLKLKITGKNQYCFCWYPGIDMHPRKHVQAICKFWSVHSFWKYTMAQMWYYWIILVNRRCMKAYQKVHILLLWQDKTYCNCIEGKAMQDKNTLSLHRSSRRQTQADYVQDAEIEKYWKGWQPGQ